MTTQLTRLPRLGAVLLALTLTGAAMAQQKQDTRPSSRYGKVGNSIQRGTDAAGRGVANADHAARRGIDKGSETASRPVRNLGDKLGRAIGLGPARSGPPARGPQSEAP